jgi:hypothetical protein
MTFGLMRVEIALMKRQAVRWPPSIPPAGTSVVFTGFPGLGTIRTGYRDSTHRDVTFSANLDRVNEFDISVVRPPDSEMVDVFGKGMPPRHIDLGGMSGGPVFSVVEAHGIVSWALAGVLYEYGSDFEILKAVRADLIARDGIVLA